MSVHFSSKSDDWATPQDFYDKCNAEFGPFDLDACAGPGNAKCARYFSQADNGLAQTWSGKVWMNPPYGRTIGQWMRKAYESAQNGGGIGCLPRPGPHRHRVVAQLRGEGHGAFHSRSPQIRWPRQLCALPQRARHLSPCGA